MTETSSMHDHATVRSAPLPRPATGAAPARRLLAATWVLLSLVAAGCGGEAGDEAVGAGKASARAFPAGAPADVVLVTIDTLRADAVGYAGETRVETPLLDRLAAEGRAFTRAHAHNVVTLPSHANILTGLYPYQHGVRENSGFVLEDDVPTAATLLSEAGYRTAAFVGAYPLDERFGLGRGFEVYDDDFPKGHRANEFRMPERRGDEVVARALDWWRANEGEKRFLWVHLYDPHAPYAPPEPWAGGATREERYLGEVSAVDSFLTPLLEPLLDADEGRAPLVVVTSDHGEGLGDHGEATHGLFAYQSTLAVPLVLWGPGVAPGEDGRTVGHVDLLPTMLAAAGVEPPPGLPGHSLLGPLRSPAPVEERQLYFEALSSYFNRGWAPLYGLLEGTDKYIHLPLPELYDLAADPAERENLVDSERRTANLLRRALPEEATRPPERRAVSAEEAAQLRSLGYLASDAAPKERFTAADDPKNLIELDEKIHQVIALHAEGRLERAVELAREVVAERPEMALGYEHLATLLRDLGRAPEAAEALEDAVRRGVDHPQVVRALGLTLAEVGRGEEAVAILEPMAAAAGDGAGPAGDDLDVLNALGVAYYTAGRLPAARRALERVLAADPDNAKAQESLGAVALAAGDPAAARRHLERAIASDPQMPIAWNNLGVARQLGGDTPGALVAWQRAAELDPRQYDALYNLGLVAAGSGRPDLAAAALRRYVATAPPARFPQEIARARQVLASLGAGRG